VPRPGNERGLAPDGGGAGIPSKITPPARCKGGAWGVKSRPAPSRNELYSRSPALTPRTF